LADEGNGELEATLTDHKTLKKYAGKDWEEQLDKTKSKSLRILLAKKMTEFFLSLSIWFMEC